MRGLYVFSMMTVVSPNELEYLFLILASRIAPE
jgi:hypothetical protein